MGDSTAGPSPARTLAEFLCGFSLDDVPDAAVRTAERSFLDTTGVAIAGARRGAGEVAASAVTGLQGTGGASTLLGRDDAAAPLDAAFVNGTAAHCLDYDDVVTGIHVHPSAPMVPAILAVGEHLDASGREALAAYVAGFETQYYVAAPVTPDHYERGWHATATYGAFGAAAAAGRLLGLDADGMRRALDAAASMPSGLKRNFGSMAKPMHAGQAARAGVTAAVLAADGFTATRGALGFDGGFFDLYRGESAPDPGAFPSLGDRWALREDGVDVKKYPCCYFTHSSVAAAEALAAANDVSPAAVDRVAVEASRAARDVLVYDDPSSGLEAKFSMPYAVASAIARDRVGVEAFTDDGIDHPATAALVDRVSLAADPDLAYGSHAATVTVELTDGTVLERHERAPPGTADDPLSDDELAAKFEHCVAPALGADEAAVLRDRLADLRTVDSLASLFPTD